eukprot:TRINITY_DN9839_c0_g1_i2.p1 TRINITY_DN9839_c0_g1~~TRINITY_DN9839_c0_g1_i2.p1  ORF type:complete len:636 (+),score=122.74 TRINITY_DN9839_c0_g1_i2:228-1910(+)
MKQTKREKMLEEFEQNKTGAILFCTDVAARGLDIPDVHWIVQFDPPQDPSAFVHRAGRTARMGRSGDALVYLLPSELDYVEFLSVRKVPMEEQAKFEVRQAVNCNQNDEVGEVGQGLKEQNLTENQDGNESIDEIDENKSVDSMDIKESQIVQNVQDSQQRDRSNQKNRKKKGKMQLFQTDKEDSQDQQETSQKFGNQLGCGKEVNSLDMSSQQNHFNGLQGKKKIDNLSPKVLVQNQHIQGKDQSQFQDIDAQFLAQRDRDVMEKGRKAFVAFVRGYKEHYCRFIFRLEELDAVKLGKAFGLLQLPRMREIKRLKNVKEFQSFDVDLDAISYKDKVREKQRKKALQERKEKEQEILMQKELKKRQNQQQKRDAQVVQAVKQLSKRQRNKIQECEEAMFLDDEYRLLKKLKKRKITEREFDEATGILAAEEEKWEQKQQKKEEIEIKKLLKEQQKQEQEFQDDDGVVNDENGKSDLEKDVVQGEKNNNNDNDINIEGQVQDIYNTNQQQSLKNKYRTLKKYQIQRKRAERLEQLMSGKQLRRIRKKHARKSKGVSKVKND